MRPTGLLLLISTVSYLSACSEQDASFAEEGAASAIRGPLSVYVVNYPLQYFAERVGGEHVRVAFPAPAGGDPAFWEPGVEEVSAFQQADLILLNGASYAKWVQRVSLPASRMVDTSIGFSDRFIPLADQATHSHGAKGEHAHGDVAFTTWLDPLLAIEQAGAIRDALIRLRPSETEAFQLGFAALEKDLLQLDGRLADAFGRLEGQALVFSHPVYHYLMRRYAIDGYAVHWEPDVMPGPAQWQELQRRLGEHPARLMVWEGVPDPATVSELEKLGLQSVVFPPCARRPAEGDYLSVMRASLGGLSVDR